MARMIRLTESDLRRIVAESVFEAVDGGWEVDASEAQEAYELACQHFGEEDINRQIVQAIGSDELAACLAFIFRMNDFREWDEHKNSQSFDDDDEDLY